MKTKLELLFVRGSQTGRWISISPSGSRLGRSRSCEIKVADPILSRRHCLFEFIEGELRITDLASENGTFVNGASLESRSMVLRPDFLVTAGGNDLLVVAVGRGGKNGSAVRGAVRPTQAPTVLKPRADAAAARR